MMFRECVVFGFMCIYIYAPQYYKFLNYGNSYFLTYAKLSNINDQLNPVDIIW